MSQGDRVGCSCFGPPPGGAGGVLSFSGALDRGAETGAAASARGLEPPSKTHLVVMVHGLGGSQKDWRAVVRLIQADARLSHLLPHASECNAARRSLQGVHACGDRLVAEITGLIAATPTLRDISIIGHSFGGLLSRYAIGRLFDPASGLVRGLQPRHFITVASPHLGCDLDGGAQLPLFHFMAATPVIGAAIDKTMKSAFTAYLPHLGQTGKDLFLHTEEEHAEGGGQAPPIVEQLTQDVPGVAPFMSALRSFATRTVYANVWGDMLVGWANSSLRFLHELPVHRELKPGQLHFSVSGATRPLGQLQMSMLVEEERETEGKEEGEEEEAAPARDEGEAEGEGIGGAAEKAGSWSDSLTLEQLRREAADSGAAPGGEAPGSGDSSPVVGRLRSFRLEDVLAGEGGERAAASSPGDDSAPATGGEASPARKAEVMHKEATAGRAKGSHGQAAPKLSKQESKRVRVKHYANETVDRMLLRLQSLAWNRVDVTFKSGAHAFNSHNHIKEAKRGVAQHMIDLIAEFEQAATELGPYASTTIQFA
mmetsp:Transcript_41998/g.105352  ORF Transcript_41998/g.105352 Transcript_41998/m.105352 type:complete len:540 (+) Transcript_41998:162-1781(+)